MDSTQEKRLLTLSASKMALWFSCPMAFFLRYIQHAPVPEKAHLTFGKAMHYYLDKFYETNYKSAESFGKQWNWYWIRKLSGDSIQGKEKDRLKLTKYALKPHLCKDPENPSGQGDESYLTIGSHIDFGQPHEDGRNYHVGPSGRKKAHSKIGVTFDFMRVGREILHRFYERHKTKEPPLYREKSETMDIYGHKVIVVFDRIDKTKEGKWFITDYKTDKYPPKENSFTLHRNPQFTLYSAAARKLFSENFGKDEEGILYYHLRTGKVLKTRRSQTDFDYLKELLDRAENEISQAIKTGKFVPHYGYNCGPCSYQTHCEGYSVSHGGPKIAQEGRIIPATEFKDWYTESELEQILEEER